MAKTQYYIHFHPKRAQPHEIVNNLARMRAVIEQAILQHHLLGVKADPFVRPGIVIMPPDRIFVFPGKAKLEIMSGNSFVDNDRPRILRGGAPEITKIPGRLAHVANAVLIQSRRRSEIVVFAKTKNAQIFRHRSKSVMLQPTEHGENDVLDEKVAK